MRAEPEIVSYGTEHADGRCRQLQLLQGQSGLPDDGSFFPGEWIYLDGSTNGDNPADAKLARQVDTPGQLYRLSNDLHQDANLYEAHSERVANMLKTPDEIRNKETAK